MKNKERTTNIRFFIFFINLKKSAIMVLDSSFDFQLRVKTMLKQPVVTLNLEQMNLLLLWVHVNISN